MRKGIFRNLLSIILCCSLLIGNFQNVYAEEDTMSRDSNTFYIRVQMMKSGDTPYIYEEDGKNVYLESIINNGCILVDYALLCDTLKIKEYGGDYTLSNSPTSSDFTAVTTVNAPMYQAAYEKAFSIKLDENNATAGFFVQKNCDSSLKFYMREGSDVAFAYTPKTGVIITHLGSSVQKVNDKLMVPLVMFLNLIDSYYYIKDDVVQLYPGSMTAIDVLTNSSLQKYNFDVIADSNLSKNGYIQTTKYDEYYRKFKSLCQGALTLDYNKIVESLPMDTSVASSTLSQQLSQCSIEEQKKLADIVSENSMTADTAAVFSDVWQTILFDDNLGKINAGTEQAYLQILSDWDKAEKELIEQVAKSNTISLGSKINTIQKFFKTEQANLIENEYKKWLIDAGGSLGFEMGATALNAGLSATVTYFGLANAINKADQSNIDAVKTYVDNYNKRYEISGSVGDNSHSYIDYKYSEKEADARMEFAKRNLLLSMPKQFVDEIYDNMSIYGGQNTSMISNSELRNGIFSDIKNSIYSYGAGKALDWAIADNVLGSWSTSIASFSWDIVELIANKASGGAFDALDAIHDSIYAMQLENDSEIITSFYGTFDDIDTYRQLLWIQLKSYYLARMDLIAFYYPENTEQYKTEMPELAQECDTLLEMMAVLKYGGEGITQEALDSVYENCNAANQELCDNLKLFFRSCKGKVTDEDGNSLKAGIIAKAKENTGLEDEFAQANDNGEYSIMLQPGTYTLTAEMGNKYKEYLIEIEIPDWNTPDYEIPTISLEKITQETLYEHYKQLINQYEDTYGLAGIDYKRLSSDYFTSWMTGLCYLELIDFDNNGMEELLLVYKKTKQKSSEVDFVGYDFIFEVWEYNHLLDSGELYGGDGQGEILIITKRNDNTYVLTGSADSFAYNYYHGYKDDGTFGIVREALKDENISADNGYYTCKINGNAVSEEEWEKTEKEWSGNERTYPMNSSAGGENDTYNKALQKIKSTKEKLDMDTSYMSSKEYISQNTIIQQIKASVKNDYSNAVLSVTKGNLHWEKTFGNNNTYPCDVYGVVDCFDLTGDGEDELILEIEFIGSTYGAADVYVYTFSNNEMEQILYVSDEILYSYKNRYISCCGVSRIENGKLYIASEDSELCFTYKNGKWKCN